MRKIILITATMLAVALNVNAALITNSLSAEIDVDIRSAFPDKGFNRDVMVIKNRGATDDHAKAYIRFKLPDNFGSASNATFTLNRSTANYAFTYDVYLLNNGIAGETDWSGAEGVTGTTWTNAPGNDTGSGNAFTNAALVGTFLTTSSAQGGAVGDSWSINGEDLINAVNEDSNGYVTLMVSRRNITSSLELFASSEHETVDAPELLLEYTPSGVVLAPDADVDIRSAYPDKGFNRTVMVVKNRGATDDHAKAYIRFKLPDNFGSASNATFTLNRSTANYAFTYDVYLLNDGIAGETDWSGADGVTGTTWTNAPGNDTGSGNAFTNAALVGTFLTTSSAQGGAVGDSWSINGEDLINAVNEDSNGYVTLMVSRRNITSSLEQFASSEHATYEAPALWLDYTSIPSVSVDLVPNADADIRSFASSTNSHNRDILAVINRYSDPSVGTDAKAYVRYKLPADFGSALSATFTISRAVMGVYDAPYSVSGLNDGVSGESDWIERDSFYESPGGMSWDNAPGNLITSPSAFTDSAVVGTFTTLKAANGGVVGDRWSVSGAALTAFLNADSNGYVTLMIGRTSSSSSSDQFASRESASWTAPTLTLQYTAVPAYDAWIGRYPGVGTATNLTDDADGDSLDNLSEFALGGDPSSSTNTGVGPEVGVEVDGGGTNWFTFVHAQRVDAGDVGLTYRVEQCADLVDGVWTNSSVEMTGTGVWDVAEFNAVTNRVLMDGEPQQFLRLIIESD